MKFARCYSLFLVLYIVMLQAACISGGMSSKARKLIEIKDYQAAIQIYQGIVDAKPGTTAALEAQLEMGKLYIKRMNKLDAGVKVYNDLISASPESEQAVNAHYELGMCYFRSKKYELAQAQFDTIVNKFSANELSNNAQLMLAKSYEEAEDYEQAAEIYDNFANRHPSSNRAAQALVNKARIQKDYLKNQNEAKRTYQSLVKKYGKVDGTQEQIREAKQELTDLGASIPKPEDLTATRMGRAIERQNKRRERDRPRQGGDKSRAMGGAPSVQTPESGFNISATEVMRSFGGSTGSGPGGGIRGDQDGTYYDAELMIANFLYGDGYYNDAGALLFDAIHRSKAAKAKIDPYAYVKLSVCYRKIGMHQRAKEILKEAVKRDRGVIDAVILTGQNHYSGAKTLEEEKDKRAAYERAIGIYNSVVGLNQNKDAEIYYKLGLAHQKMGNPDMERESFERSIAAKPDYIESLAWLPDVYKRMKNRPRAEIFQDILEEQGDLFTNNMALADLCYQYENYRQAKSKYSAARRNAERGGKVDINTESLERLRILPGVGTNLAEAIIDGRPYEQVQDLLKLAGIDERRMNSIRPRVVIKKSEVIGEKRKQANRVVHSAIRTTMAAYKLGQTDWARETMKGLAEKYPEHPLVPYGWGEIALLTKDGDTAVAFFKEAIEKDPHSDFAPVALGEYYLSLGYDDEALAIWTAFIKENRYNRNVNQRLKKLKAQNADTNASQRSEKPTPQSSMNR